jgi:serine/threonine protein kinase
MRPQGDTPPGQRAELTPPSRGTVQIAPIDVEHFDEYVMIAKIGQGGMAEVFLALSRGPGSFRKLLVIKRLHAHLSDDPQVVQMFLQEATLAARLHHPHVVQTNKVGSFRGHVFLAMEYLEGQPLHRVLARLRAQEAQLPAPVAARIIADVLDGLHYAHELCDYDGSPLSIVHRDVSPQNVFVTYDGQVKLLDFGIAKAATLESHTRHGLIKGKFSYIAPEQARGEDVDRRADVWSMGVTLWECLAGERPFRGNTEVAVLRASLSDDLPLLSELAPQVPEDLARIVERALQRERALRHPSALAFKDELEGWLGSLSRPCSRTTVAAVMKALFYDKMDERKEIVRQCIAQVAEPGAEDPTPRRNVFVRPASVHEEQTVTYRVPARSTPMPLPRVRADERSAQEAARARSDAWWKVGVVALVLVGAALFGWLRTSGAPEPAASRQLTEITSAAPSPPPAPASAALDERPARVQDARPGHLAPALAPPPATRGGAKPRVMRSPPKVSHAEPAPPASAASQAEAAAPVHAQAAQEPGRLRLDSTPYAVVSLEGKKLGITPIDVELPAATHTLMLRNPEQGLETRYRVTIPAGESVSRRIALE